MWGGPTERGVGATKREEEPQLWLQELQAGVERGGPCRFWLSTHQSDRCASPVSDGNRPGFKPSRLPQPAPVDLARTMGVF